MAWMYILECADGSYYVGSIKNLVFGEEYDRISDGYSREKQLQNRSRAKREVLINGYMKGFRRLLRGALRRTKNHKGLDGRVRLVIVPACIETTHIGSALFQSNLWSRYEQDEHLLYSTSEVLLRRRKHLCQ